jgi:nucleoside-diphosphate-sugar epimerase
VIQSIALALSPKARNGGAVNLGTGVPTKIKDLSNIMSKIMGKPHLSSIHEKEVEGDIR